jgi:hypothetical protein
MNLRFAIAMRLFALWWAVNGTGGLRDIKPERLRNDLVNLMYVSCATFWDGFLSSERKMLDIYEEVVFIADDVLLR